MSMAYRIVYLEDQEADSVIHDLTRFDLEVLHCNPTSFKETIESIDKFCPNLILMDFRLMERGGEVNAPAFAQYYRSLTIDDKTKSIPIVLLSNDEKIHGFYEDFTSHDLFDFAIKKSKLSNNLEKYTCLMKELIESYRKINELQSEREPLVKLLCIPENLVEEIDPRIQDALHEQKLTKNIYMASSFILDSIVKPIGVLIGEDVLSARLGVSKDSPDWEFLCRQLEEYHYKGVYSDAYDRWWAEGVESWWENIVGERVHLRRLSSDEKVKILDNKYNFNLSAVVGDDKSRTHKFWTICQDSIIPVDPSEAFEIKPPFAELPWVDRTYYSFSSVRDQDLITLLTDVERSRYKSLARG
ncbi:hypothetical protein [Vibrio chagasii]|uniref:hypothetical protein n=1 Tax=Vibrio chagasii TaxID=170679 RepID=UPI001EFCAB06|nr:hypothetical protein [Vibrio chagasii]MCG9566245.1 hypothetical protein [Vibrio chagasii]